MSLFTNSTLTYISETELEFGVPRLLKVNEIDNNYRSLYYSSSIQNNGATLRLHRDINDSVRAVDGTLNIEEFTGVAGDAYTLPAGLSDFDDITLGSLTEGSSVIISGEADNRILTATATPGTIQAESGLLYNGAKFQLTGSFALDASAGRCVILIGEQAGESQTGTCTVYIGYQAGKSVTGNENTALGVSSLQNGSTTSKSTAVGFKALCHHTNGNFNTALGATAGQCVTTGASNVLLGYGAGPNSETAISNKLYINNQAGNPLILGDFSTGQVTINSEISASIFSGSFHGDGSNLTGLSLTAFPHNGDAVITGSLTVSGSSVVVDLTDANAISGSIFSGSFTGDGSNLTGITSTAFPHSGSADITGSFSSVGPAKIFGDTTITGSLVISGSTPTIDLKGVTTIDQGIKIHSPEDTSIGIGANSLGSISSCKNVALGYEAGCEGSANGCFTAIGYQAGRKLGHASVAIGANAGGQGTGLSTIAIGYGALGGSDTTIGGYNIGIGATSAYSIETGTQNIAAGFSSLFYIKDGSYNIGIGSCALHLITNCNYNIGLGHQAGCNTAEGSKNIYIGPDAGPSTTNTIESNQLYINNAVGNPLIGGDFSSKEVTISGSLAVSQSIVANSFSGDGSGLTGVIAEWDGSLNGNADITGSLTVSSSIVDFTNSNAISGSIFSGSFVGDGSGLTNINAAEWDGTRNGDSNITGSLIVSGALDVGGAVTIATGSYPGGPGVELIPIHGDNISAASTTLYTFAIGGSTNYTGFKADYSLTTSAQDSKKIGTLLASWNPAAGTSVINEEHTLATGHATTTSFEVDASDNTNAIFKLNVTSGTFELNGLITAFKRVV